MRSCISRSIASIASLTALLAIAGSTAHAELIYGLGSTTNSPNLLFTFDSATPGTSTAIGNISGLVGTAGESVVGIDFRPLLPGTLFALTNDSGTGRLYTINPSTGAATLASTLSIGLTGTAFGMDFNPTGPVALRIVSNDGTNLRIANPLNGVVATDTALNTGIVGVAYNNNDNDAATGTTIFYINSGTDFVQTAANPNTGPATNIGTGLGANVGDALGFDISGTGAAYAAVNVVGGGGSTFHNVNVVAGTQTLVGGFNTAQVGTVRGIAALPSIAGPEPGSIALFGAGVGAFVVYLRRRRV